MTDLLTGVEADEVADDHLLDSYVLVLAIAYDVRLGGELAGLGGLVSMQGHERLDVLIRVDGGREEYDDEREAAVDEQARIG